MSCLQLHEATANSGRQAFAYVDNQDSNTDAPAGTAPVEGGTVGVAEEGTVEGRNTQPACYSGVRRFSAFRSRC